MTRAELTAWQYQHVGVGPCVLLPGQYLLCSRQTLHERQETLRLLRLCRSTRADATQARHN
jgi:hypothetical protein